MIWHDHLKRLVEQRTRVPSPPKGIGPAQFVKVEDDYECLGKFFGQNILKDLMCAARLCVQRNAVSKFLDELK